MTPPLHTQTQVQWSVGPKDRVKTNGRTDGQTDVQMDGPDCFTFPANAVDSSRAREKEAGGGSIPAPY